MYGKKSLFFCAILQILIDFGKIPKVFSENVWEMNNDY